MKLLFDQNLSRKLVDRVRHVFPGSDHVAAIGLDTASDREIWDYARERGYAVVSKDSDFRQLAFLYGAPPKVIWLRIGNASTAQALQVLLDHVDDIVAFDTNADVAFLVLPEQPN